ncbi:MAG: hypothetical protein KAI81_08950, partial [Candidatus Marinimicrobia bacterium]|nr:hypothetical protein [Candidatus Neomarinimicrobiota bacterium]
VDSSQNAGILSNTPSTVIIDNTSPSAFTISYVVPDPDSINYRDYYGGKSESIFTFVPIDDTDGSLLEGSVQIKMKGIGTVSEFNVGDPIDIANLNDKNIELDKAFLDTVLFNQFGIEDGIEIITRMTISDKAGNITYSPVCVDTFTIDRVKPVAGSVIEGTPIDIDFIQEDDSLRAVWSGFSDLHTELDFYEYSIGSAPDLIDFVTWQDMGTNLSVTDTNHTILHKQKFYFNIRVTDLAGNVSDTVSSDGVLADFVRPVSISVMDEAYYYNTEWTLDDTIRGTFYDDGGWVESLSMTVQRSSDDFYWHGSDWIVDSTNLILNVLDFEKTFSELNPSEWTYQLPVTAMENRVNYIIKSATVDSAGNIQNSANIDSFQFVINTPPDFLTNTALISLIEDTLYLDTLSCADIDRGSLSDDSLRYVFDFAPQGMNLTELTDSTVEISWQTNNWNTGDTLYSIIATDSRGAADTLTMDLTVIAVNDVPEDFTLINPLNAKHFNSTDADSFKFTWEKSLDVDDTLLTYKLSLFSYIADTVDTNFYIENDTTKMLDLQTLNFPNEALFYWTVEVADT